MVAAAPRRPKADAAQSAAHWMTGPRTLNARLPRGAAHGMPLAGPPIGLRGRRGRCIVGPRMQGRPPRIVLISPKGPLYRHRGGIWRKSLRYQPLTLTTLASLVPAELNADVSLIDEGIDDVDPARVDADLVGMTVITGTATRA